MNRTIARACLYVAAVLFTLTTAGVASGQEFRGSIGGTVVDATGGVLPAVTVVVRNTATNVTSEAITSNRGTYLVPYLPPGEYEVNAELMGFRKEARRVQVQIADRLELNFTLHPGGVTETVVVTAETPLLQTKGGSLGQVVDTQKIASLPLADGNPFVLSRLAPGTVFFGDLKFARPFDNNSTSAIAVAGAPGGNDFTLDGVPNTGARSSSSGPRVAFVPPSDAVQEFKVETTSFDAQQGHTAGAIVNVALKSGTNVLKGTTYAFVRNDKLAANDFFLQRAGQPKAQMSYYRWGGTAGGPIAIPGLYNGHDKTFFFASYERLDDEFPEPNQYTVPTDAMRNGDLSYLTPLGIQVYDPLTAKKTGSTIVRQPFANNSIPADRINPVATAYLKYYPRPNQAGDSQGRNNYQSGNPRTDAFNSLTGRADHVLTAHQRLFVRGVYNRRRESRNQWSGEVNGIVPTGNFLYRSNYGVVADHTYTITPTTLLNVRGGWSRFDENNVRPYQDNVDMASLGFSPATVAQFNGVSYLPRFNIGDLTTIGGDLAGGTLNDIASAQATLTKIFGNHSLRTGYEVRKYRQYDFGPGDAAGYPTFNADYTRATSTSSSAPVGQRFAAFLLGLPTGGTIERNASSDARSLYHALFVQDDWKITNRLTLNAGLRYDYETSTWEAANRNIQGFDPTVTLPITGAAQAAYAANPIPERPASSFLVQGGLQFASAQNPGVWTPDKNNVQPRVGFAYKLAEKTVARGGVGLYSVPFVINGIQQYGFSQSTPISVSLDGGLTFRTDMRNPWPGGVQEPAGSSLGPSTYLGQSISFTPTTRKNARSLRMAASIQHELRGNWVVEATYVGNRGFDLQTSLDMNPVPRQFLSTSSTRDTAVVTQLDRNVPNPFYGLTPGQGVNKTVKASQLLKAYPQFTGVSTQLYDGSSRYDSILLSVSRRFSRSLSVDANYTYSRMTERVLRQNATDPGYVTTPGVNDVPHRIAGSVLCELPFKASNRTLNGLVSGWSLNAAFQVQSGRLVTTDTLDNLYYSGDPNQLKTDFTHAGDGQPIFDTSGFYFTDAAVQTNGVVDPVKQRADQRINLSYNLRTFPVRLDGLRQQWLNEWNLSIIKRVPLTGRVRMELRVEILNAFNQVFFGAPSLSPKDSTFGIVTSQSNLPREVQLAAKLVF